MKHAPTLIPQSKKIKEWFDKIEQIHVQSQTDMLKFALDIGRTVIKVHGEYKAYATENKEVNGESVFMQWKLNNFHKKRQPFLKDVEKMAQDDHIGIFDDNLDLGLDRALELIYVLDMKDEGGKSSDEDNLLEHFKKCIKDFKADEDNKYLGRDEFRVVMDSEITWFRLKYADVPEDAYNKDQCKLIAYMLGKSLEVKDAKFVSAKLKDESTDEDKKNWFDMYVLNQLHEPLPIKGQKQVTKELKLFFETTLTKAKAEIHLLDNGEMIDLYQKFCEEFDKIISENQEEEKAS